MASRLPSSSRTVLRSFSSAPISAERLPSQPSVSRSKAKRQTIAKSTQPKTTYDPPASSHVLNSLIALHHTSASFMHDADSARIGFENAFKCTDPKFMKYNDWKNTVLRNQNEAHEMVSGMDAFDEGSDLDGAQPAQKYWTLFKEYDSYAERQSRTRENMTEREQQVKEALFGTYERGGIGMSGSKPGLPGILEYLKAKNVTVEDFAREWRGRHGYGNQERPLARDSKKGEEESPAQIASGQ